MTMTQFYEQQRERLRQEQPTSPSAEAALSAAISEVEDVLADSRFAAPSFSDLVGPEYKTARAIENLHEAGFDIEEAVSQMTDWREAYRLWLVFGLAVRNLQATERHIRDKFKALEAGQE